jgi:hypothetical protein
VGFYTVLPKIRTLHVPIRTPHVPIRIHIFEISILSFGTRWVPLYPYGTRTRTPDVPGAGTRPKLPYRCMQCFMFLVDLRSIYVFKGIELTIANTKYVENERD